jgi:hypothetical protein
MTDCTDGGGTSDFSPFDATQFESNATLRLDHEAWERKNLGRGYMKPSRARRSRFNANDGGDVDGDSSDSEDETDDVLRSPSCRSHFDLAGYQIQAALFLPFAKGRGEYLYMRCMRLHSSLPYHCRCQ